MTFISFAEWLNRQLFMTTMNKSPNYRNYLQLSPLQMGHSNNHACSPVASHSPHVIWTCLLGQPPMVIGDMFIAGEHDHHKMGCISHQEQWVISNYFHLDVAPFVSYLIQTGSKLIPCGNQTWQLKHSRFIFPLQHPFSSGIFHCHVWLAGGKINLVAGLHYFCVIISKYGIMDSTETFTWVGLKLATKLGTDGYI
jgi:hypothetical protein